MSFEQYGAPGYPAQPSTRPGVVTAAAVLAFVVGGLNVIFGLVGFGVVASVGGAYAFLIILNLAFAALLIWGGVQAINGRNGTILVIAAGISILLQLISMITYFSTGSLIGLVIPILILVFMLQQPSRNWIRSRGGKTF
ncbi:hypothetical protein GIS00_03925 [Nakamurella sp. YIM 132087]|uniref:Uncharacterized protein n=1 Tax=Nakamurella alba TaxID=2665158 RepID=A0A7K1FG50_9ACTN|nr:hypothetical protein [Nakamurella alba]MTD13095.1 hypothetical protein [Nakamurella alba]